MKYQSQDFARCNSSYKDECKTCARNVHINPVHPEALRQVWVGVWVIENERCPSRVPMEKKET